MRIPRPSRRAGPTLGLKLKDLDRIVLGALAIGAMVILLAWHLLMLR